VNRVLGNIVECTRMQLSPEIKVGRFIARKREQKPLVALFENTEKLMASFHSERFWFTQKG
jgi:hypothetical protein